MTGEPIRYIERTRSGKPHDPESQDGTLALALELLPAERIAELRAEFMEQQRIARDLKTRN